MSALRLASILILLEASTVVADSRALAQVPLPTEAASFTVSSDVIQNGLSTSIVALATEGQPVETLDYYKEVWRSSDAEPGHVETQLGDWRIISRLEGETLLVVQVRETANGSEGFVSAMSPATSKGAVLPPPPMPAGGQLLSSLNTLDAGRVALTSVVSSTARPGEVAAFYRDQLLRDGWALSSDRVDSGTPVLLFDRDGARLEIVISRVDGQSIVIVNEVQLDG